MKTKMNIKSIIIIAVICLFSMFFINICFAANTGKVSVETVKLRKEPNTESTVLELASLGEEVEILGEEDTWYKVKYKKITGYIRKDLLQVEENTETTNTAVITNTEPNVENNKDDIQNQISEQSNEQNDEQNQVIEQSTTSEISQVQEENLINNNESENEVLNKDKKYKLSEDVKLKIIPLIIGIETENINKESEVGIIEILNDWARVRTLDEKEGWVRIEKLVEKKEENQNDNQQVQKEQPVKEQTSNNQNSNVTQTPSTENSTKTMYVNSETVNVRKSADKSSSIVMQLSINTSVKVISTENGWCKVDINGKNGYIASSLLSDTKQETSRSLTSQRSSDTLATEDTVNKTQNVVASASSSNVAEASPVVSTSGNAVVEYAKKYIGCKYVYGGTTTNGFDCSGFTQFVYKHFGVSLNRTAAAQYSNGVSVKELQPGDLVMFGKSGINHVGIYIGGNNFVHAANKSRGVTIDTLSTGYYKTNYVGARRIL